MGFVQPFEIHQEYACSHTIDIVDISNQLIYKLLAYLQVFTVSQHILGLHDWFYCLLPNCKVMIFEEVVDDFLVKLAVVFERKGLEEVDEWLSYGKFKPPFFVSEAALNERDQILYDLISANHFVYIHNLLHYPNPYALVLVL